MTAPIFLLGAERSGELLLELMLAGHPKIAWGGDFDYALDWAECEYAEWPPLIPYRQRLAYAPRVRELRLRIDRALDFPDLVRSLFAQQRARSEAPLFGVSAHGYYDRLLRLWPYARFIYLKSSRTGAGALADHERAQLRDSDRAWRRIAAQIEPQRRFELRYESLVTEPGSALRDVCLFLGVTPDIATLRRSHATPTPDGLPPAPRLDHGGMAVRLRRRFALAASRLFAE